MMARFVMFAIVVGLTVFLVSLTVGNLFGATVQWIVMPVLWVGCWFVGGWFGRREARRDYS